MLQYVGQQHREGRGWGKKDKAEKCVLGFVNVGLLSHWPAEGMCSLNHGEPTSDNISHWLKISA